MTFKIRKITYNNGGILYYPMVKKGFRGWYYIKDTTEKRNTTKCNTFIFIATIQKAHKMIDNYKKGIHKKDPIIKDILVN